MWRQGQVVGIADQVGFIVGRSTDRRYAGCWDVTWVDSIGERITLAYDEIALWLHGNRPGEDRVGVPGIERIGRNPLQAAA